MQGSIGGPLLLNPENDEVKSTVRELAMWEGYAWDTTRRASWYSEIVIII
jgi:hypothetical protein